jgi:hypothetical protein
MNPPYTYEQGMKLTAMKQITKGDMVTLCRDLNTKYVDIGLTFEPEPITEGGIVYKFTKHPDNSETPRDKYKSIRMNFNYPLIKYKNSFIQFRDIKHHNVSTRFLKQKEVDHLVGKDFSWQPITPNVMELWENNDDVILEKGLTLTTHLKAFRGAPVFTENELKVFGECAERIGLKVDSKIPKNDKLISTCGELGM